MSENDIESLKKENELLRECVKKLKQARMDSCRKYLPVLSELIDRLCITQLKEFLIPEHREEYSKEIKDILYDLDLMLKDIKLDANTIRAIIVLVISNREIWLNESACRKGIKDGNNLYLSHSLNSVRNLAKNKIQSLVGGRKDYKLDVIEADSQWIPSWSEDGNK